MAEISKSEFLVITIPKVHLTSLEVDVEEFATAGEAQDFALERMKEEWVADVVSLYRHPGKSPLANKWWAGLWNGYGERLEVWRRENGK